MFFYKIVCPLASASSCRNGDKLVRIRVEELFRKAKSYSDQDATTKLDWSICRKRSRSNERSRSKIQRTVKIHRTTKIQRMTKIQRTAAKIQPTVKGSKNGQDPKDGPRSNQRSRSNELVKIQRTVKTQESIFPGLTCSTTRLMTFAFFL